MNFETLISAHGGKIEIDRLTDHPRRPLLVAPRGGAASNGWIERCEGREMEIEGTEFWSVL